jgi:hypothetical protein
MKKRLGFVSELKDFSYQFVPKIACTSIKRALFEAETGVPFDRKSIGCSAHQWTKQNRLGDVFGKKIRLLVVRDPVERFLSAYSNRVGFHRELSFDVVSKKFPNIINNISIFDPDIDCFVNNLEMFLTVPPIKHHFFTLKDWINGVSLAEYSHVYPIEKIIEAQHLVSEIYDKDIVFGRFQTGGVKIRPEELSSSTLQKIKEYVRSDYNILKSFY